ncbi:MAG: PH domain-containing protein [Legionellaceae bacterium]|nr:PH domain-containing protein [Legionellaceae bacterium]
MTENKVDSDVIYQAHLHWILFVWPIVFFCFAVIVGVQYESLRMPSVGVALIAVFWEVVIWLTYQCSYLIIKKKQVILCTGIFVRQTLDISLNKIESIDIRQSILGSILHYGSLVITGTGGTRQYVNFLNRPLTCRRYIEQTLHD